MMGNEERKLAIKEIKKLISVKAFKKAFSRLSQISSPEDDFVLQSKYYSLIKSIPPENLGLKKIRLAILASSTTAHLSNSLKFWMAKEGFAVEIFESEFDTIRQTVLDTSSTLYAFKPEIVILFTNYRDIMSCVPMGAAALEVEKIIDGEIAGITSLWEMLQKNLPCHIIQNNADLPPQRVFGNYEGNVVWSGSNFLRRFNLKLAQVVISGVTIFDLDMVSSVYGKKRWHDARYWYHSKHAFTLDAIGFVAFELSKQIVAIKGLAKKCIVLDLDNTLWGGVVGDDGLDGIVLGNGANGEALVDFQKYLLGLKNRGIILAVSSKNDEKIAKEPFLKHPDMQLKLEDIAVFSANWENKVDNIRKIAATLNLGLDSIVFVDDNPAERLLVRSLLPLVSVPEMPEDPTEFINMLNRHSYFETVSFSEEDKQRSDYYRQNASRNEFQKKHENISEYLKSLGMSATIGKFDKFNLPRIVQLINKSNQFHLTATRYLENEILALMEKNNIMGLYFKLKDRFGDNGLISVLILEKTRDDNLFINTWVMSCRVLMRGLEEFINEEIISLAKSLSCKKIIGKYTPTNKNKLVADLYRRLHFEFLKEEAGVTFWALDLEKERPKCQTFISKAEN